MLIDAATIAAFQCDGAVVIRGALSATELSTLTQGIKANLAAPGPLAAIASKPEDPGQFIEDFCNWQRIPEYESLLRHSALPRIAQQLMQSQSVRIYHDHLLVKTAGAKQPTPWHQDQPYYNIDGRQHVSFWVPVDPIARETTLEFLAGCCDGTWYLPGSSMKYPRAQR